MADNVTTDAGTGGAVFATDDIGGVHYPITKITIGALDSQTLLVGGSGVVTAGTPRVTLATDVALPAGNNNIGDVDVASVAGNVTVVQATASNLNATVVGTGTFAVQATLQASTNTQEVVGDAAHDAAAAGNPLLMGGYASAAAPTDVSADADAVRLWALRSGALATQDTYAGVLAVAGNGAAGTGVQRVTLASDSTGNIATIGTSVTPGTAAANLGKAEDAAHTTGDVGVMALSVRQNTAAATSGTDGDYQPLITDTNGRLHVLDANSAAQLTSLQLLDDAIFTDDAAFTPATSKVTVVGYQADETSTDSVDEGDAGAARMTLDRKQIVTPQPHTAGGLSIARDIDLDNSTLTVVKASAGQLYGWDITNTSTATVFVKFYNATSGTLGTGTPVLTIGIPGNSTDDTLASKAFPYGVEFTTGICVGAGTGVADADNTDPGANAVVANIYYK